MFSPGELSGEQARLLNEMAREFLAYGNRVSVTSWPLTVHRAGRLGGQIIGIDPKAFADDDADSGSGDQLTIIIGICLDGNGGGYVRKITIDRDNLEILDEWCEPIPVCGSGVDGGLCDDLPPPSGSGSGSGSGIGHGTLTGCCGGARTLNDALTATMTGEGNMTLTWDGTYWSGSKALSCGETLYLRYKTNCTLDYSCNGTTYAGASPAGPAFACGATFADNSDYACDMDAGGGLGCVAGSCGTIQVISVSE